MGATTERQGCPACSKLTPYINDEAAWHEERCGLVDRKNLMRIHIVGGPGSGKTTLARQLGSCLGAEVHELDLIAFTGLDFVERSLPEREARINLIVERPAWITEGLFILWTGDLLACSDIIVWLDHINWSRSVWRTARRFTRFALQEVKNRRGIGKFTRFHDYSRNLKQLIQVFFSSRAYFSGYPSQPNRIVESRQTTVAYLAPYQEKVIHCHDDEGIKAFMDYIHLCHSS